ncbi:MAG: hypothetical protein LBQ75_07730 [Zoogloeaceae bacterium]|jgi:hypothetical protein|nr:hypothetical protein [Zoogloeaceae bacterium]
MTEWWDAKTLNFRLRVNDGHVAGGWSCGWQVLQTAFAAPMGKLNGSRLEMPARE